MRTPGESIKATAKIRRIVFTLLGDLKVRLFAIKISSVDDHNVTHSIRLVHTDDAHNLQQSYNHRAHNHHKEDRNCHWFVMFESLEFCAYTTEVCNFN